MSEKQSMSEKQLMAEIMYARSNPYGAQSRTAERDAAVQAVLNDNSLPLYLRGPFGRMFVAFPLGETAPPSMGQALPCQRERHLKMSGGR